MSDHTRPVRLRRPGDRRVDLTPLQRRIVAGDRVLAGEPLANMAHAYRLRIELDADRFVDAVEHVVGSSDVLRLSIGDDDGVGWVSDRVPGTTDVIDLDIADVEAWTRERIAQPLDPTVCVYDSVLLRHAADDWTWWSCIHHVATDAASAGLVAAAVFARYDGEPTTIDGEFFGDDVIRSQLGEDRRRDPELDHGEPLAWYGPVGERTPAVVGHRLDVDDRWRSRLADLLDGELRSLSRELGLLAVAAASCALLARRIEGRDSLVVGVPLHHRSTRRTRSVVGPLMEIHALRIDVRADDTFRELHRRTLGAVMDLLRSAAPGSASGRPTDVVLNVVRRSELTIGGRTVEDTWVRPGRIEPSTMFRLHLVDRPDPSRPGGSARVLDVELDENAAFRPVDEAVGPAGHLSRVFEAVVADPDTPIAAIDVVTVDELAAHHLLQPDPVARPTGPIVPRLIATTLTERADQIIVEDSAGELTAGAFDAWSATLAAALAEAGVGAGDRVGIRVARSAGTLAAITAVHRLAASFVMLSPSDPDERVESICADAGIAAVIDDDLLARHRPPSGTEPAPGAPFSAASVERWAPAITPDAEAYVLYTSGSTGMPKGVPISHLGLADYLRFAVEEYAPSGPPVVALHSELVFDLTITSLFLGLVTGGRTIVVDGTPIDALASVAADDRVTFLKLTPSQLELYLRLAPDRPRPLRCVVVGGEAFRRPLAERLLAVCEPGVEIVNEYGPTEAVVGCMIHRWDPDVDVGADVPIGAAAAGGQLAVLDHAGRPAPVGSWGELWVRRPGMAQHYVGLPDASAERFVPLPAPEAAGPGDGQPERWYRTGDRVRIERPGVLVFGGRQDDQLKVRGIRLEPGEVESALVDHPLVEHATVRIWKPATLGPPPPERRCVRCGLGADVPGVQLLDGVCNVCLDFDRVAPQADAWFRTGEDLDLELAEVRRHHDGDIDCLHLLSGGKDSTYALYQLVQRGWRVHALTLDNGFISEGAKENVRRTVADLGISHEFATTPAMNEIFRDSLDRYANVCQGCYKTIYTIAVARARELDIPVIVTGLSRGQFFETRLVPHQFEADRFDPEAIDETVLEARKVYHHTDDAVTRLLPEQAVFDEPDVFDRVRFLDFYRYVDVDLEELYAFLDEHAPWVRPADTGRSTNCLINVAGIHVHRSERGYHNYAEPYSWDVRLGHKTRDEALEELDDPMDPEEIDALLEAVGYRPKSIEVLTCWYRSVGDVDLDPNDLRAHLRERLPDHAVPTAFVRLDEVPLASGTKVDIASLPTPARVTRSSGDVVDATTEMERWLCRLWRDELGVERVGVTDDFFDLGGASLAALSVVAAIDEEFGTDLPDAAVFRHRTVRELAELVEGHLGTDVANAEIEVLDPSQPPPHSAGEEAMLFEYRTDPSDPRYNVTRLYRIEPAEEPVDRVRLVEALIDVVMIHEPLHVTHASPRARLDRDQAVAVVDLGRIDPEAMDRVAERVTRLPFDLDHGPLVRVHHGETDTGVALVLIGVHHIGIDAGTFDLLWRQVAGRYETGSLPTPAVTYAAHGAWQRQRLADVHSSDAEFWADAARRRPASTLVPFAPPVPAEPDGYLHRPVKLSPAQLGGSGSTSFARAMAATAVVLSGAVGRHHVEFGVTSSVNDHALAADLVGYFLNTLPVALVAGPTRSVADVVADATRLVPDLIAHRRYPFARIVRESRAIGAPEPSVRFMLAYEELAAPTLADHRVQQRILASGTSVSDCTFFVQERVDGVEIGLEYRGAVLSRSDATRLLSAFETALHRTVDAAGSMPAPQAGRTGWEIEPELSGPPLPAGVLDGSVSVPGAILERLRAAPESTCVVDSAGALSGGDLAVAVAELVDRISERMGSVRSFDAAGRPPRVAVEVARSSSVVVGMLACWLAGASYVPVDPTTPERRRERIREAARPTLTLVDADGPSGHTDSADGTTGVPVVPIERAAAGTEAHAVADAIDRLERHLASIHPDHEAYTIFTSGSTGRPKGVGVTHRQLAASTFARSQVYPRVPARFLVTSSIGFDSSMVGLVWPLIAGGTVVLPDDDTTADIDRLADQVAESRVTHVLMVPSLYRALLDRRAGRLVALEVVIVAGEAVGRRLVDDHHRRLPGVDLVNEYGPTEATVWSTWHRLSPGERPYIGRPVPGATVRVVGEDDLPVAVGAEGELLVAGPGVTSGYLDDDDLTQQRFGWIDGRIWYRTGDRVRVVRSGGAPVLDFLGRADDQLNVGGNRLEPAEVEHAMERAPGVVEAAVVAAGDPVRLVGHVRVAPGHELDDAVLRRQLAADLPSRSIPSRFVVHTELPRTVHGKLDRAALVGRSGRRGHDEAAHVAAPAPGGSGDSGADLVRAVWASALDREDLTVDHDFFDVGGDSLSAVVIVTDLGHRLGREVPIADLLVGRTPRGLARLLGLDRADADIETVPTAGDGVALAVLRPAPVDAPLVVLTAAWDEIFGYQALAEAFGEGVGVVALTIDPTVDDPAARSVDGFADRASRLVGDLVAGRPSALVGWSIGGIGAVAVGDRLRRAGTEVDLVALIDTYFPGEQRHLWSNRWWKYRSLVRPGGGRAIVDEARATVRRRARGSAGRLGRRLLAWAGVEVGVPSAEPRRSVGVPPQVHEHPIDRVEGPMLFVQASTTNPARTIVHWRRVATHVDELVVEGRHRGFDSIMAPDRVGHIAAVIEARLGERG